MADYTKEQIETMANNFIAEKSQLNLDIGSVQIMIDDLSKSAKPENSSIENCKNSLQSCEKRFRDLIEAKKQIVGENAAYAADKEGDFNLSEIESKLKKAQDSLIKTAEKLKADTERNKTKTEKTIDKEEKAFEEQFSLDGGDPRYLYVTSATKVGDIDRALSIWKKIQTSNGEEKSFVNKNVQKLEAGRRKIINYANSKVGLVSEENKVKLARLIGIDKSYKYVSIDAVNNLLPRDKQGYIDENELNGQQGLMWDILEGKTGVDYMTVVKSTLGIAAIATLGEIGAFGLLADGFALLAAFNPVVAACAAVLGAATLIKYARQLFAPEIKKLIARHKTEKQFAQLVDAEGAPNGITSDKELDEFLNTYGKGVPPKKKEDGGRSRGDDTDPTPPVKGDDDDPEPPVKGDDDDPKPPVKGDDDDQKPPVKGDDDGQKPPVKGDDDGQKPPVKGDDDDQKPPVKGDDDDQKPPVKGDDDDQKPPVKGDGDGQKPPVKGDDDGQKPPVKGDDDAPTFDAQLKEITGQIEFQVKNLDEVIRALDQCASDAAKASTAEQTAAIQEAATKAYNSYETIKKTIEDLQSTGKSLIEQNVAKKRFGNPQKPYLNQLKINETSDVFKKIESKYQSMNANLTKTNSTITFQALSDEFTNKRGELVTKLDSIKNQTNTMKTPEDVKAVETLIGEANALLSGLEELRTKLEGIDAKIRGNLKGFSLKTISSELESVTSAFNKKKGTLSLKEPVVENENPTPTVDTTALEPKAQVIVNQIKAAANKILTAPEGTELNVMAGDFRALVEAFKNNYPSNRKTIREIDKLSEKVEEKVSGKTQEETDNNKTSIWTKIANIVKWPFDKIKDLLSKESTAVAMTIEEVLSNIENSAEIIKNSNSNEEIMQQAEKYHAWKGALKHYHPSFFKKAEIFFEGLGVEAKIRKAAKDLGKEEPSTPTDAKKSENLISMAESWTEIKKVGNELLTAIRNNPSDPTIGDKIHTFNGLIDKFKSAYKNEPGFDSYNTKIEAFIAHIENAKGDKIRTDKPIENEKPEETTDRPAITDGSQPDEKKGGFAGLAAWLKTGLDTVKGWFKKEIQANEDEKALADRIKNIITRIKDQSDKIKQAVKDGKTGPEVEAMIEDYRGLREALKEYNPNILNHIDVALGTLGTEKAIKNAGKEPTKDENETEQPKKPNLLDKAKLALKQSEFDGLIKKLNTAWNDVAKHYNTIANAAKNPADRITKDNYSAVRDAFSAEGRKANITYQNLLDKAREVAKEISEMTSDPEVLARLEALTSFENCFGNGIKEKDDKGQETIIPATDIYTKAIDESNPASPDFMLNELSVFEEMNPDMKASYDAAHAPKDNIFKRGLDAVKKVIKPGQKEEDAPAVADEVQKEVPGDKAQEAGETSLESFIAYVKVASKLYLSGDNNLQKQAKMSHKELYEQFVKKSKEILEKHPESAEIVEKLQTYFAEIENYRQANKEFVGTKGQSFKKDGMAQAAKNAGLDKATLEALGIDPNSLEGNDGPGNNG